MLPSLPRTAVRLLAPALIALATLTTTPDLAVAATVSAASHAKPPKKASHAKAKRTASHRKSASKKSTSKKTSAHRTASVPAETALPTLPVLAEVPSIDEVLSGRSTTAPTFASASLVASAPAAPVTGANPAGPLAAFSASASRMLESMVDRARSQLGTRYVFGGERPGQGLDCSSFARFAMEAMGIKLPRTAAQQAKLGDAVPRDRNMLRPGDLLTFGRGTKVSHVGIYLGEGRFIHASVKSRKIIETTIDRNPSLFRRWQGARRLVADGDSSRRGDG